MASEALRNGVSYDGFGICECGILLDAGEGPTCVVCENAPHHRDCPCDECEAYWLRIANEEAA